MPSPLRSYAWRLAMLSTLQLLPAAVPPWLPPAAAQVPSQSLVPSMALRRPPAHVAAPAYPVRTAAQTTQAGGHVDGCLRDNRRVCNSGILGAAIRAALEGAVVPRPVGSAPLYGQPPEPPPVPDRGLQIIQMQLAHRSVAAPRRLAPTEATAMWRGYTARIGKAPALGGAGGGGGGGSTGGGGGTGATGSQ